MKRIAFIINGYPIGVSSMIVNSIRLFAQKGFFVDIYTNRQNLNSSFIRFTKETANLIVHEDSTHGILLRSYRFLLRRTGNLLAFLTKRFSIRFCISILFPEISAFSRWIEAKLRRTDYEYIIPVEFKSLVCLASLPINGNVVYYNLELMDWAPKSSLTKNKLLFKYLEYRAIKSSVDYVVVPSPRRAEIFSKINAFDRRRIFILPVASMGEPITEKSSFFRAKFSISDDRIVVVYSGNLRPWTQCLEVIKSVKNWPKHCVLVIHTWNNSALDTPYHRELTHAANGLPVFFSEHYIEYDELPVALSSADIGIAFYEEVDDNFTEILFSSNKIGEYLKAGLPVVCSDLPSLREFVEANQIGLTTSLNNLPRTIKDIAERLSFYKQNALSCYQTKYRFEVFFQSFCARLFRDS